MWNNSNRKSRSHADPGYVSDRSGSHRRGRDRSRSRSRGSRNNGRYASNDRRSNDRRRSGGGGGRARGRESDRDRVVIRDHRRSDYYSNNFNRQSRSRVTPAREGQVGHQNYNLLNQMDTQPPADARPQNVPDKVLNNRNQNGNFIQKNTGNGLELIKNLITEKTSINDTSLELIPYFESNVRPKNNKILFYSSGRSGYNRNQDKLAPYTRWSDFPQFQPVDHTPTVKGVAINVIKKVLDEKINSKNAEIDLKITGISEKLTNDVNQVSSYLGNHICVITNAFDSKIEKIQK